MDFKKFSLAIAVRTVLIMLNAIALSLLLTNEGYHAATLLAMAVLLLQSVTLVRFVSKTNAELARFLDAARYADYSQRFELTNLGTGFAELGNAFSDILKRFQSLRSEQEEQLRHLKAIVEHVPVPLISIDSQGQLTMWNSAARKLFGANPVTKLDDLTSFGEDFSKHLSAIKAGERRLVYFNIDGMEHRLSISATQILLTQNQEILISMQDIQGELDVAQLQAWQDLVRVLTHEIMNSITPVASLAKTAVDLVEDSKNKLADQPGVQAELDDVAEAVRTVASRSDGLIQFVSSYRKLTRLPTPNKKLTRVASLIQQVSHLATQDWSKKSILLETSIHPAELDINVDVEMFEQLLLNLLKNAEHAVESIESAKVNIMASLNARGHVVIEICDNGKGVPEDIAKKIFVPFYTTKKQGSGVGLALSRQIMIAHGGSIKYAAGKVRGAVFTLIF